MSDEISVDPEADQLFECLASYRRRFVLQFLAEESNPATVDELTTALFRWEADSDDPSDALFENIQISLFHHHLPKLAEAGLVIVAGEQVSLVNWSVLSVIESMAESTGGSEESRDVQLEFEDPSVEDPGADILLVEDNLGDVRLMKEAFSDAQIANSIYVVGDGEDALDFIYHREEYTDVPRPDLILLDLSLPWMNGDEVLAELKDDRELKHIPGLC